jgi:hypothetical protein
MGVVIYGLNALVSMHVHRCDRSAEHDDIDAVDRVGIGLWAVYNAFLVARGRGLGVGAAVVFAALVLLNRRELQKHPWRSPRRTQLHGAMHVSGSIGSCMALLAAAAKRKHYANIGDGEGLFW